MPLYRRGNQARPAGLREIMTTLKQAQTEFVESVLQLKPRVAAFDCDGTLWSGDAGEGFFYWEMERGLVSDEVRRWAVARHADYKAGNVAEEVMCGEMVTLHHGLREEDIQKACDQFFAEQIAPGIFPEMRELVRLMRESGCDIWAVSSSSQWLIESGMRYFGIPRDRVLAAQAAVENGVVVDKLLRVPSGPGKPEALRANAPSVPECAFGNSIWDHEMLQMVKHPFVINPTAVLREIAMSQGWKIYQPEVNHKQR